MKAAQLTAYGGQDSIKINEVERPKPSANQVLVAVYAAALNPFDWKVHEGHTKEYIKLEFPATLGGDLAGIVEELGDDVNDFEIGQEVYGIANATGGKGSFAEYVPVNIKQLANKPKSIDFETAAALPLVSLSAYQGVIEHIDIQPGQKILIHGGAGGIGSIAIQLAKNAGAYVATTASAEDAEFAKQLGADEVIDYKSTDFSTLLKDFDAVFDTVGGETNKKSYGVLRHGGILVSMVEEFDEFLVKETGINYIQQNTIMTTENLDKIADLVDQHKLKVKIDKVFPLEQAAEAMQYLGNGNSHGKIVLKIK